MLIVPEAFFIGVGLSLLFGIMAGLTQVRALVGKMLQRKRQK